MSDREYTIERIERILELTHKESITVTIPRLAAELAASMLKEQEPVRVGKKIKAGDVVLDFYSCGHCKNAIRKPWRYCPFCGKKVKWE